MIVSGPRPLPLASANCGRYCGADLDFVDIDPATGLMSVQALSEKLESAEREELLPKVLVPVHLCGTSCDMASIDDLADRYGFLWSKTLVMLLEVLIKRSR